MTPLLPCSLFIAALLHCCIFSLTPAWGAANTWTTGAATASTVGAGGALVYPGSGDTIYAIHGNATTNFRGYSIINSTWTALTVTPAVVNAGGALVYPGSGDTIYAFRGGVFTDFWGYNIKNNTWVTMAAASTTVGAGGSLVYPGSGDTIYALYGNATTSFRGYSISNNTWAVRAAAPATVGAGGALVYPGSGDTIYALGGNATTNFWGYSISNNAWTALTVTPAAVNAGGALVYPGSGDTVYAFRGNLFTDFWAYNIKNNTWTTMAAAPATVDVGGALVYPNSGDTIYALGGNLTTNFWGYTVPFYAGPNWYVNDASTVGDSFTTAAGDTTGDGSKGDPFLTITKALTKAKAGDTIFIDAGTFTETVVIDMNNISLIGKDSASTIIDPPGPSATAGLYGIYADTQVGLTIKNLAATGAYNGIRLYNVDSSTIAGDSVSSAGNYGIYLLGGCDNVTVTGNASNSNSYGIYLDGGSNNTVTGNEVNSNSAVGLYLISSSNNTLTNNTANSNAFYGIDLISSSSGNRLAGNTANSNSFYGIYLESNSNNNTLTRNIANSNSINGVYLTSSSNNSLVQNTVRLNTEYQVYVNGTSSSDTVEKNNIQTSPGNPDSGVYNGSTVATGKLTFTRNWWGTTDEVKIKKMIYQESNADSIIWSPYRLGQVDTVAGADTTAPAAPSTFSVTLSSSPGGPLTITWANPTLNEETNGGAVGFNGVAIYKLTNLVDTTHWGNFANEVHIGTPTETTWIDTNVVGGSTYYYRLTSHDSAAFENESFFNDTNWHTVPIPYNGPVWYVNDTNAAGDSFTGAPGNDSNTGESNSPFKTITKALSKAHAGDTIKIDAGLYSETVVIDTDNLAIVGKDSTSTTIDPPVGDGIFADTQSGLLIKNLAVTGANVGIKMISVTNSTITGDSVGVNTGVGIKFLHNSDSNKITANHVANNVTGIELEGANVGNGVLSCDYNTIDKNYVAFNTQYGISVIYDATYNTVSDNTTENNTWDGFLVHSYSKYNLITKNISKNNRNGINLLLGTVNYNFVANNLFASNNQAGVKLGGDGPDTNAIVQNDIVSNDTGVWIVGSCNNNIFTKNNISGNTTNNVNNEPGIGQSFDRNFWGTANEVTISAKFKDTASAFRPYRLGKVDTAPGADTTAPGKVTGLTLDTSVAGKIKLTWTLPAINEETNGGTVAFNGANIWRLVNLPDTTYWSNTGLRVKSTISTETTWTDTNVVGGSTYYYRITSKDAGTFFNESFFTDTKFITAVGHAAVLQVLFVGGSAVPDIAPGETLMLEIIDTGANTNAAAAETVTVRMKNLATNEQETGILDELDTNDAVFKLQFRFSGNILDNGSGSGKLYVVAGDTVQFDYTDPGDANDTEQKILKVIPVLELKVIALPDTQIKHGDTSAVLAFKIVNENPMDNASPTDTVTGIQITRLLGGDTYLASSGVKLWFDTGSIGVFQPAVDILDFSASIGAGQATLTPATIRQVFTPGDTRHFIVTFETVDSSALVGDALDAKIAIGGVTHNLGGNVPDTDINTAGQLAIIASKPKIFVGTAQETIATPASYNGPGGDTIPGATLTIVLRYDNDGGETAAAFTLNAKIPQNTTLFSGSTGADTAGVHTGASATVAITDDSGVAVSETDPNAKRIRWTFSAGVGANNGDAPGVVDAAISDVDAGFVKYKVYIK